MDGKARKRIYPELRIKETHVLARILGIPMVPIGFGLVVVNLILALREPELNRLVFGLVGLAMIYGGLLTAGLDLREWLVALLHRRVWQGVQVTADGEIVDQAVKTRSDGEGGISYTYWITFRFDSTEGAAVLKAQVDKPQYDRLKGTETVMVRYALDNPRLALLEGEWED